MPTKFSIRSWVAPWNLYESYTNHRMCCWLQEFVLKLDKSDAIELAKCTRRNHKNLRTRPTSTDGSLIACILWHKPAKHAGSEHVHNPEPPRRCMIGGNEATHWDLLAQKIRQQRPKQQTSQRGSISQLWTHLERRKQETRQRLSAARSPP